MTSPVSNGAAASFIAIALTCCSRYWNSFVKDPSGAMRTPSSLPPADGSCLWIGIACGMFVGWKEHWPGVSITLRILGSPGLGLR